MEQAVTGGRQDLGGGVRGKLLLGNAWFWGQDVHAGVMVVVPQRRDCPHRFPPRPCARARARAVFPEAGPPIVKASGTAKTAPPLSVLRAKWENYHPLGTGGVSHLPTLTPPTPRSMPQIRPSAFGTDAARLWLQPGGGKGSGKPAPLVTY